MAKAPTTLFHINSEFGRKKLKAWRRSLNPNLKVVFTNGVFDILHYGHVMYLKEARKLGDILFVGINSDKSVRMLDKGPHRPLIPQQDRAMLLDSLRQVDAVAFFDDETPLELIKLVRPNILVKGGDYSPDNIVGAEFVKSYGGKVKTIPLAEGRSTTGIVEKILERYK